MIQYNKLYQSLKKVTGEWHAGNIQSTFYWNYLMFFEDQTLIESNIASDNLEEIVKNFSKDNANLNRGKFELYENQLNVFFDNTEFRGGIISSSKIILQSNRTLKWDFFSVVT